MVGADMIWPSRTMARWVMNLAEVGLLSDVRSPKRLAPSLLKRKLTATLPLWSKPDWALVRYSPVISFPFGELRVRRKYSNRLSLSLSASRLGLGTLRL